MDVQLSIQSKGEYLRAEMTGEWVRGEMFAPLLNAWTRMAEECRAAGVDRMLVVNALTGKRTTAEMYRLTEALPAVLAGRVSKIAVVVTGGEEALRVTHFGEDVVVNRGFNGRVFADEAPALEWLEAR